jgi:hypothetical protein
MRVPSVQNLPPYKNASNPSLLHKRWSEEYSCSRVLQLFSCKMSSMNPDLSIVCIFAAIDVCGTTLVIQDKTGTRFRTTVQGQMCRAINAWQLTFLCEGVEMGWRVDMPLNSFEMVLMLTNYDYRNNVTCRNPMFMGAQVF